MRLGKLKVKDYVIYGIEDGALAPDLIHCDIIEDTGPKFEHHIKPHLHSGLIQIALLTAGRMECQMHLNSYTLEGPACVIVPENTLHEFKTTKSTTGLVISFTTHHFDMLAALIPQLRPMFTAPHVLHELSTDNARRLTDFGTRVHEFLHPHDTFGKHILRTQLDAFILVLGELIDPSMLVSASQRRDHKLYDQFFQLVRASSSYEMNLSDYADQLKITPTHLNRICHSVVGKTATDVLREYFVQEASKYLLYTGYNISEIADLLEFNSVAYFCRFFKKSVGLSPMKYRKQQLS